MLQRSYIHSCSNQLFSVSHVPGGQGLTQLCNAHCHLGRARVWHLTAVYAVALHTYRKFYQIAGIGSGVHARDVLQAYLLM